MVEPYLELLDSLWYEFVYKLDNVELVIHDQNHDPDMKPMGPVSTQGYSFTMPWPIKSKNSKTNTGLASRTLFITYCIITNHIFSSLSSLILAYLLCPVTAMKSSCCSSCQHLFWIYSSTSRSSPSSLSLVLSFSFLWFLLKTPGAGGMLMHWTWAFSYVEPTRQKLPKYHLHYKTVL